MPDPAPTPHTAAARRVALVAVGVGLGITGAKFALFYFTSSVAVLSDALESIINVVAACMMLYATWYASRPADRDHPYGHGKIEFLAVGLEGWLILGAAVFIGYEAIARLISPQPVQHMVLGIVGLNVVGFVTLVLAIYLVRSGKRYDSPSLTADGKHLLTDAISTFVVGLGLLLVRWTGEPRLDPIIAIVVAACILFVSWRMLWQSAHGLMDRQDPKDNDRIRAILDEEVARGTIRGYHKLRHRHSGAFHWIDLHLQIDGDLSIRRGHDAASAIERRIEAAFRAGQANATAHVEPADAEHLHVDARIDQPGA